ncbi:MAG: hypothetical protein ABSA41_17810 [Terriglobia bacterium]
MGRRVAIVGGNHRQNARVVAVRVIRAVATGLFLAMGCFAGQLLSQEHKSLRVMSQRQLIDGLKVDSNCKGVTDWDIPNELVRRGDVNGLIEAYRSGDGGVRSGVLRALSQIREPRVDRFMHEIAFKDLGDGPDHDPQYWPLEYLAEECNVRALARLDRDVNFVGSYPVASIVWARTIKYFRICS